MTDPCSCTRILNFRTKNLKNLSSSKGVKSCLKRCPYHMTFLLKMFMYFMCIPQDVSLGMVQDLKRQMLNAELEQYELKIQQYEYLYEQELATFQSEIYKTESSYQICHLNELMYFVKIYVYHHTKL